MKELYIWLFSYNSFVKFHGKKIWEQQHDVLYPNLGYALLSGGLFIGMDRVIIKSCYRGTVYILSFSYNSFVKILWQKNLGATT